MFAYDEARLGLITWHKRRYRPVGIRPPWVVRRQYQWTWLYAAVEPATGEVCCWYLRSLDGACYHLFLQHLSRCYPDDLIVLVRDNAPAHRSQQLTIPHNIALLPLPTYSPELSPVERLFLEFRRLLANRRFDTIDDLHEATTEIFRRYWHDREALKQLTNFPWWRQALEKL